MYDPNNNNKPIKILTEVLEINQNKDIKYTTFVERNTHLAIVG